jgi:hypothetical protein
MARARNIKPGFFANEYLADCSPLARLLFIGLWTIADREGRLEDRPKRIKAQVLPFDDCDIDALMAELAAGDFIQRYTVDGAKLVWIPTFAKHQHPHHNETASELPALPTKVESPCDQNPSTRADSLLPLTDSLLLNPDSLSTNGAAPDKPAKSRKPKTTIEAKDVPVPDGWTDSEALRTALDEWLAHKRRKRSPLDAAAVGKLLAGFESAAEFIGAVNNSIANGYVGCFAPTTKGQGNGNRNNRHNSGRPSSQADQNREIDI